ncbi:MAG: hypothetical protein IMZ43_01555 [Thermoplasmata archaeon]|nr:hypothetical protein [Thermoplasmata archaeon]
MTPPPEAEAWPDIEPSLYQSPFPAPGPRFPTVQGIPPLGVRGCPSQIPSPEGAGVGGGVSLVPYISITPKIRDPSDIAFDALSQLDPDDSEHKLCFEFVKYLDRCEQKKFMIKGYDTVKGEIINLPMEYTNRWCPIRRGELSEKLKRLEYWFELQEDQPVTMITLTSGRRDLSIAGAWVDLNKSKKKLQDLLRFYFGDVDYFWVPEPHKDGYVHYHMAVFADVDNSTKDKRGEGIEDKLRNLWSKKYGTGSHTYGLDFSHKKGDGKIQHLKNYLSKYLEKGFLLDKWTSGMLKFNANLWETGFRMYGASKRIRQMMNIEPDKPSQIVWLETKMVEPEEVSEDIVDASIWPPTKKTRVTIIESERIIWYRQYIPDWIDSDFWLTPDGRIMPEDPPPQYICDWGRPCSHHAQEYKVTSWQDTNIPKRKHDVNPYDTWRPAHTNTHN